MAIKSIPSQAAKLKEVLEDRANMRRTIADLRRKNDDLNGQVTELSASKPITPAEREEITRLRAEHKSLNDTQNAIIVYMRKNMPEMLTGGDLSVIICNALAHLKQFRDERKAKPE